MMRTLLAAIILVSAANVLGAQQTELSGQVQGPRGNPLAGAEISFSIMRAYLPQGSELVGSYSLAQMRHLSSLGRITATSDASGNWHRQLADSEAAILTVGGHSFLMQVLAPGYLPWFRAVGGDLRASSTNLAQLERSQQSVYLQVALDGGERPYRGFALIERQFRIPNGRFIWLPEIAALSQRGAFSFAQAPRIPGELMAQSPTARAEAYRISIHAVGLETTVSTLPVGSWRMAIKAQSHPQRPVLDPDGGAAETPIRATYVLANREVSVKFNRAQVAMIGDLAPTRISNAKGYAWIRDWQPGQPIILTASASEVRDPPVGTRAVTEVKLTVIDRNGQPVSGSAIWLDDSSVRDAAPSTQIFAITDDHGRAILRDVPVGSHRLLARHPYAGLRELRLELATDSSPVTMPLRPPLAFGRTPRGLPGTLLLDLGKRDEASSKTPTELGFITTDRRLIRHDFADRPRWIRLEGLPRGAISLYLQSKGEPAVLIAGILSGGFANPPLLVDKIRRRRFRLSIRNVEGQPLRNAAISFGEGNAATIPYTSRLVTLQKGKQTGSYWFEAPIHGSPLMRIHDRDGGYQDVLIPIKLNQEYLEVVVGGR